MARTRPKPSKPKEPCIFINPKILTTNFNTQEQSPLICLPSDILTHEILPRCTVQTKDKITISLVCKHLALSLPRPLQSQELARQVTRTSASAQITKRVNFMMNLEAWVNEGNRDAHIPHEMLKGKPIPSAKKMMARDYRLCSVCLVFKNTMVIKADTSWLKMSVQEVVETSEEWCCVTKKRGAAGGKELWICPKHKIDPMKMVQLREK